MVALSLLPLALAEGTFTLSPDRLPVHEKVTVTLRYTVGPGGMAPGAAIRVHDPVFHGMRWSKWGFLSTRASDCSPLSGPTEEGSGALVSARVARGPEDAALRVSRNLNLPSLHEAAWTEVELTGAALAEGDLIEVVMGDTAGGPDCGLQTSLRAMEQVTWPVSERAGASEDFAEAAGPTFAFVAEGDPVQLLVSAPSELRPGEPFTLRVAALDALGNPTPGWPGTVLVQGQSHALRPEDGGVARFSLTLDAPGVHRLEARAQGLPRALSNPILVEAEGPRREVFWGDLHVHHGHSYVDEAGVLVDTNHAYAREVAGLQFGCQSVKASPHELGWETLWPEQQETCRAWDGAEGYVALLGFEWMGDPASTPPSGHHNVYYEGCEGPLAPNTLTGLIGGDDALWAFMLTAEAEGGGRSLSVPHAPRFTGFNWQDRDDTLRPLVELYSEWGDSTGHARGGSGVWDALARGQRLGFIASSDNHDGWIGNRHAAKAVPGGFAAIVAEDLSRASLFEALARRSTYGTTGIRPILRFWAEDGGRVEMGEEVVAGAPAFSWTYIAEARAQRLELLSVAADDPDATVELLYEVEDEAGELEGGFTLAWDGRDRAVWLRVVEVDGEQAWSSPIWLTADCDRPEVVDPAGRCGGPDSALPDSPAPDSPAPDSGGEGPGGCGGCGGGSKALLLLGMWPLGMWPARRRLRGAGGPRPR